jgi:hypothetical protein
MDKTINPSFTMCRAIPSKKACPASSISRGFEASKKAIFLGPDVDGLVLVARRQMRKERGGAQISGGRVGVVQCK